jgi:C4-dicarboxylate-specific signal transduction histidine kinase
VWRSNSRFLSFNPANRPKSLWRGCGLAILSVTAALLATHSLKDPLFPTPMFFAAIVISTWFGGAIPGLLAVILAAIALNYYFIPPLRSLALSKPDAPYLVDFALPALLTCLFVKRRRTTETSLRQARDELESRVEERTAELSRANQQLKSEIAERARAEETVQKTQSELAHLTRVMTVGELGVSVAHEVNQPLMAVVLNGDACLQWLASNPPNLEKARETVSRMIAEGSRAAEIVRRMRDLAKKTSPHRTSVDLNEVVREVLALTQKDVIRNQVFVRTDLARSLPPVLGDRVQLQQVVLNLVVNAIEAMSTPSQASPRELRIASCVENSSGVIVTIEDSGPGLPNPDLEKIFTAFFTTKPDGLGMGLSISRTIIEAHGGRLWADNRAGGAIFHFKLPVYRENG